MCDIEHEIWKQKTNSKNGQINPENENEVEGRILEKNHRNYASNPLEKLRDKKYLDDSSPDYVNFKKLIGNVDLGKNKEIEKNENNQNLSPHSTFKIYDLSLKINDDKSKFNLTEDEENPIEKFSSEERNDRETIKFKNEKLNDIIQKRSNIFNRDGNKALTDREYHKGNQPIDLEYLQDENAIIFDSYKNPTRRGSHNTVNENLITFNNSKVSKNVLFKKKIPKLDLIDENHSNSSKMESYHKSKHLRSNKNYSISDLNRKKLKKKSQKKDKDKELPMTKMRKYCENLTKKTEKTDSNNDYKKATLLMLKRDKYANRVIKNQGLNFLNSNKNSKSSLILFKHKNYSECKH